MLAVDFGYGRVLIGEGTFRLLTHAPNVLKFEHGLLSASNTHRTSAVPLRRSMSAMPLRQLKKLVPIFVIHSLKRFDFVPPAYFIF